MQMSLDTAMEHTFSVAEFSQLVSDLLDQTFPHDVWVQGEVRGISRAQSGHVYFDLVDSSPQPGRTPDALLPVVLFETTKRAVNTQIKRSGGGMRIDDGVAVRIRGVPNFYAPQGKLSLRMTGVDPSYTLGQMAESRDQLLAALTAAGLLDSNRQQVFPPLALRVGLVTAAGSAAQADFIDELRRSELAFDLVVCPTPVQGVGAAHRIAAAIRSCAERAVDVIAVIRGGGAKTDLVAFDDAVVARTIAGCPVPVLTGIGHETDTCVADHVAYLSFKTPTACAADLAERARSAEGAALAAWSSIASTARRQLERVDNSITVAASSARHGATTILRGADTRTVLAANGVRELTTTRLERAASRLTMHSATVGIETRHQLRRASAITSRAVDDLGRVARHHVAEANASLGRAGERARLLDPAHALARGWSITTDANGAVVKSVAQAPPGSVVATRVADGRIVSKVSDGDDMNETEHGSERE